MGQRLRQRSRYDNPTPKEQKVFLLLFLQKKKNLFFEKKKQKL
jgi:hypothetical protein